MLLDFSNFYENFWNIAVIFRTFLFKILRFWYDNDFYQFLLTTKKVCLLICCLAIPSKFCILNIFKNFSNSKSLNPQDVEKYFKICFFKAFTIKGRIKANDLNLRLVTFWNFLAAKCLLENCQTKWYS